MNAKENTGKMQKDITSKKAWFYRVVSSIRIS